MRKLMSVTAVILIMAMLLCGCAPLTAEQVVEKMTAATAKTPCSQMELDMGFTMGMDMGALGAMEMDIAMAMDMTFCQDPIGMYAEMTVDMGMDGSSFSTTVENYVVTENDQLMSYSCTGGEWMKMASEETVDSMRESMAMIDLTNASLAIDENVTEWNGQKAICLTFQVTGDSVEAALGGMMSSNETMGELGDVDWSAMTVDGRIYVDPKTYLPLAEEMTINGMDAAMAPAFDGMGVTVEITECAANVVFCSFEAQAPIELPAEAADATDMTGSAAA